MESTKRAKMLMEAKHQGLIEREETEKGKNDLDLNNGKILKYIIILQTDRKLKICLIAKIEICVSETVLAKEPK